LARHVLNVLREQQSDLNLRDPEDPMAEVEASSRRRRNHGPRYRGLIATFGNALSRLTTEMLIRQKPRWTA
jgi:hypothetical protein